MDANMSGLAVPILQEVTREMLPVDNEAYEKTISSAGSGANSVIETSGPAPVWEINWTPPPPVCCASGTVSEESKSDVTDIDSDNSETPLIPVIILPQKCVPETTAGDAVNASHVDATHDQPSICILASGTQRQESVISSHSDNVKTSYEHCNDHEQFDGYDYDQDLKEECYMSNMSIHDPNIDDGDNLSLPIPLRVFGSGWELGSLCSINLRSGMGATAGSVASLNARDAGHGLQERLLTKIFSDKVSQLESQLGSQKLGKNFGRSISKLEALEKQLSHQEIPTMKNTRNCRNVIILSIAIMCLYTSIYGIRNLQSSLNSEGGLGVFCLAVLFAGFFFGSFVSSLITKRFPPRMCLVFSILGHLFYILANYYPTFYTLVPTSFVNGFSNAVLWNAISTYITEVGINESKTKGKPLDAVISRFFGVFFFGIQSAIISGNLISSLILMNANRRNRVQDFIASSLDFNLTNATNVFSDNFTFYSTAVLNGSFDTLNLTSIRSCGVSQCHIDPNGGAPPTVLDNFDKILLLGTYGVFGLISVMLIYFLLESLSTFTPRSSTLAEVRQECTKLVLMTFDRQFILVVPLCMYTMFSNGFVVADVLKAYITCPLGIQMVGYSMICFGVFGSASSFLFGRLAKWVGQIPFFIIATVLNLGCLVAMVHWDPTKEHRYFLLGLLGVWGFADGVWQSQTNSLISAVFADRYESAFGCCRVWQGISGLIVFLLSSVLCMIHKVAFIASACSLTIACLIVLEIVVRRRKARASAETNSAVEIQVNA